MRAERRTGERIPYGHRQDADYSHPAFRFYADRIVRKVVGRYAEHPAVIGYQVDNEPGMELFHNRGAFETFVDRLRERYGDVETLNERWGLVYWSHRLSRWDDLWTPDGNTVPSYDLAWRRFQSALTSEFISEQAAIVREIARPDQFITTCMALLAPRLRPRRSQPRAGHRRGQPLLPDAGLADDARSPAGGRPGPPALGPAVGGLVGLPPGRPDARRTRRALSL